YDATTRAREPATERTVDGQPLELGPERFRQPDTRREVEPPAAPAERPDGDDGRAESADDLRREPLEIARRYRPFGAELRERGQHGQRRIAPAERARRAASRDGQLDQRVAGG